MLSPFTPLTTPGTFVDRIAGLIPIQQILIYRLDIILLASFLFQVSNIHLHYNHDGGSVRCVRWQRVFDSQTG
jgi:hypothetical protein